MPSLSLSTYSLPMLPNFLKSFRSSGCLNLRHSTMRCFFQCYLFSGPLLLLIPCIGVINRRMSAFCLSTTQSLVASRKGSGTFRLNLLWATLWVMPVFATTSALRVTTRHQQPHRSTALCTIPHRKSVTINILLAPVCHSRGGFNSPGSRAYRDRSQSKL